MRHWRVKTVMAEAIPFWKMNGSGNDFILIDNREGRIPGDELERLVKGACRRRESVR